MLTSLLTLLVVGLVALVAVGVVLALIGAVLGIAFGLAGFLLFKVAPVVLIGYIVMRFLTPKQKRLSAEDRRWLES
ncbi:MAG TPA: hypothetical protein VFU06_09985 [Longimicrobiales bacterium]|nr:hypothetical protein [Longimicrobiales bacterium]